MEQLFKTKTVKQCKIMEWLVNQGVSSEHIAEAHLTGPAMVRVTNPAGQYMDLYCDGAYEVRILDVSEEREKELEWYANHETNDPEDQEWRDELTEDETAMVEQWDAQYAACVVELCQKILDHEQKREDSQPDYEPEW